MTDEDLKSFGIKQYREKIFSHCDISNSSLKKFTHSKLEYVSGKNAEFTAMDFSYSIMTDCYFHEAKFTNCKFIGARLYRCNFRGARFENCDFRYIDASETRIPMAEVRKNLPDAPNIARDICQVMRRNATSLGDIDDSRAYVIEELNQRKEHLRRAIRGQGEYYRRKYSGFLKKAKLRLEAAFLKADSVVWGHGEKVWKIVYPISISLILASIYQTYAWLKSAQKASLTEVIHHWLGALEYYTSFFLSVDAGTIAPHILLSEWALAVIRLVALGLLVSSLFRWLSHR